MGFGSESTRHIQAFRGPNVKRSKRSEFGDGYGMLWALWHGMLWIQNTRPVQEVSEVSSAGFIVRKDVKRWTMYNKSALWICTCRIWYARIYRHYFYIMYACKWHISVYIYAYIHTCTDIHQSLALHSVSSNVIRSTDPNMSDTSSPSSDLHKLAFGVCILHGKCVFLGTNTPETWRREISIQLVYFSGEAIKADKGIFEVHCKTYEDSISSWSNPYLRKVFAGSFKFFRSFFQLFIVFRVFRALGFPPCPAKPSRACRRRDRRLHAAAVLAAPGRGRPAKQAKHRKNREKHEKSSFLSWKVWKDTERASKLQDPRSKV